MLLIVVMAITLLTAVGMFAVRSSGLTDLATGYNRQAVQTSYLSEFAARTVVTEMSLAPDLYLNPFINPVSDPPNCKSTSGLCFTRQDVDILASLDSTLGIADTDAMLGTLGRGDSRAAFHVEIFDATQAPERQAGESETTTYRLATFTAEARLRPLPASVSSTTCVESVATTTAVQSVRGHVRFGPFAGE